METRTLIKDTATVARVTQLEEGDAYRRLIPKDTYSEPKIALGLVTGVLNNGETIAITALEITKDRYSADAKVKTRVFEATNDLALFPVDADEVQNILAEARRQAERSVASARKSLREAEEKEAELSHVADMIADSARLEQSTEDRPKGYLPTDDLNPGWS